jgi:hypothetical protein
MPVNGDRALFFQCVSFLEDLMTLEFGHTRASVFIKHIFFYRYAQYLSREDDESLVPFCTAVGDPETLIEFSCSRGQLSSAVLTAQVACEGVFDEVAQTGASKGLCNGVEPNKSYQK